MNKKNQIKFILIVQLTITLFLPSLSQAKIGGSSQSFEIKNKQLLIFKNRGSSGNKTYYFYSFVKHPAQQNASMGFAGGATITTANSKIIGESILIRLGANQEIGKIFACAICMDLTYEAIGKAVPSTQAVRESEYTAYREAINGALAGSPQIITYKGYAVRITVSKTKDNNLLLVILPEARK